MDAPLIVGPLENNDAPGGSIQSSRACLDLSLVDHIVHAHDRLGAEHHRHPSAHRVDGTWDPDHGSALGPTPNPEPAEAWPLRGGTGDPICDHARSSSSTDSGPDLGGGGDHPPGGGGGSAWVTTGTSSALAAVLHIESGPRGRSVGMTSALSAASIEKSAPGTGRCPVSLWSATKPLSKVAVGAPA
jgi:hypothetical protein